MKLEPGIYFFEGLNGVGKTTLVNNIKSTIENKNVHIIKFPTEDITEEMNKLVSKAKSYEEKLAKTINEIKEKDSDNKYLASKEFKTTIETIIDDCERISTIYESIKDLNLKNQNDTFIKHKIVSKLEYGEDSVFLCDRGPISTLLYNASKEMFYSEFMYRVEDIDNILYGHHTNERKFNNRYTLTRKDCENIRIMLNSYVYGKIEDLFIKFYEDASVIHDLYDGFMDDILNGGMRYFHLVQTLSKRCIDVSFVMLRANNDWLKIQRSKSTKNETIEYKKIQDNEEIDKDIYYNLYTNLIFVMSSYDNPMININNVNTIPLEMHYEDILSDTRITAENAIKFINFVNNATTLNANKEELK